MRAVRSIPKSGPDQTQRSLARRSLPMSALYLLAPKRRNSRFIALIWVRYVVSS
jgi:hypothetical protein